MAKAWLIRAGRAGEREQWALRTDVSGGGFYEVPDLAGAATREDLGIIVATAFPGAKEGRIQNFSAQLWALRSRIAVGDFVVMPLKNSPVIAIGKVTGDYAYLVDADSNLRHVRPVTWLRDDVPRTAVKQDLLYSLGAFLTICEVSRNDAAHRIEVTARTGTDPGARTPVPGSPPGPPAATGDDASDAELSDSANSHIDVEQHAFDRLSSHVIETFAGYRMQELVAAVLVACPLSFLPVR